MKRIGISALSVAAALVLQGCILLPVDDDGGFDPFYFDPDDSSYSADFLEVGNYQPNSSLPPSASRHCTVDGELKKVGSACWFFPVMRLY